jgi:broad specificity phosphatase PhoE
MQQIIYLTLHGETEWNKDQRFQGRLDSPLTPTGLAQSRRLGITLRQLINDCSDWTVMSSPLQRARTTAQNICHELSINPQSIKLDPRLSEIDVGLWSGLTYNEIEARWTKIVDGANKYDWYFRSPDGESLEDLSKRLGEWLFETRMQERVIVVMHGIVSRILRGLYAKLRTEEALRLEISRDAVFRLAAGQIDRIDCVE